MKNKYIIFLLVFLLKINFVQSEINFFQVVKNNKIATISSLLFVLLAIDRFCSNKKIEKRPPAFGGEQSGSLNSTKKKVKFIPVYIKTANFSTEIDGFF